MAYTILIGCLIVLGWIFTDISGWQLIFAANAIAGILWAVLEIIS